MDLVGIERAGLHELFDFRDRDASRGRHHRIEIARGLAIDEIAFGVALPRLDDGKVRGEPGLEHEQSRR